MPTVGGASAYDVKGEHDKAIADYGEAIRLDPEDTYGYIGRAAVYQGIAEYDKAIADYSEAIRIDPDDSDAYHDRGQGLRGKRAV